MLNAEMIVKKGIKPEDLYFTTAYEDTPLGSKWSNYDDKSKELIGSLAIKTLYEKDINPIDVWLYCDEPFATYVPTKGIEFVGIRKVNVLIMNTCPPTMDDIHQIREMIALKKAICERFNSNCHVVDMVMTLDDFMERCGPIHFDYFVFMNDWSTATREDIVKKLYFANCPWEYAWRDNELIPINHEKDLDMKFRALEKEIQNVEC